MGTFNHQHLNDKETIVGEFDLLVTKTDAKGRLTYASSAFQKIAELTEEELLGQPHNIIRHPDMPRAIFYHLWSYISKGEEVFAFVKNRTSSGGYYWVLAHVTPITRIESGEIYGYHSSRRRMPNHVRSDVEALYARLRDVEASIDHPKKAAMEAHKVLLQEIGAQSSTDYTKWLFNLIAQKALAA
jgi:PAS domain S-box-containing protein